jgi:hypothetical protein
MVARNLEFLSGADRRLFEAMFRLGEVTRTTPPTPLLESHSFPVTLSDEKPVTFQSVLTPAQIRFLHPPDEGPVPVAVFFRRLVTLIGQVRAAVGAGLDGLTEALTSLPRATKGNGGKAGKEPRSARGRGSAEAGEGARGAAPARRTGEVAGDPDGPVQCCCYSVGGVQYMDPIGAAECDDRGGVWRSDISMCLDSGMPKPKPPRKRKGRGRRS